MRLPAEGENAEGGTHLLAGVVGKEPRDLLQVHAKDLNVEVLWLALLDEVDDGSAYEQSFTARSADTAVDLVGRLGKVVEVEVHFSLHRRGQ